MNKPKTITIRGKEYPCGISMGAYRRYKKLTGKEGNTLTDDDISGSIEFAYCATAAACNAEGVEFDLDLDTFADCLAPEALAGFFRDLNAEAQKKTVTEAAPLPE